MTRFYAFLPLLLAAFVAAAPVLAADKAEKKALPPAAQFIQNLGDKAIVSLTDKSLPRASREARTREILRSYFDVPTIARFALGTYWRTATEKQKSAYMDLFEDMIVETYTTRFEDYSGQSFVADKAEDTPNGKDSIVSSRILQKGGPPVLIEWRVRKKEGTMKIVDVVVENISMSVTQRSDFAAVIQRGGGSVDALIESLKNHGAEKSAKN